MLQRKIKKIILFSIFILLFSNTNAATEDSKCMDYVYSMQKYNDSIGSGKNPYEIYSVRVNTICEPCYTKSKKVISSTNIFQKAEEYESITILGDSKLSVIKKVKSIYRENMNSLYQCALIDVQKRAINLGKTLTSSSEVIKNNLEKRISSQESKLDAKSSALGCINTNTINSSYKQEILNQSTYEACKYLYYLDYLNSYYNNISNTSTFNTESKNITSIADDYTNVKIEIEEEIKHTYKVFPLAFQAFNEYEDYYIIHFLLTIIKDDFIALRDSVGNILVPINQLVYKIKDAMSTN